MDEMSRARYGEETYRERHGDEPRDEYTTGEPEAPHDSPVVLAHVIAEAIRDIAVPQHEHKWRTLGVWYPPTGIVHPLVPSAVYTVVLVRCRICKLPDTLQLTGKWTLAQVRGIREEAESAS